MRNILSVGDLLQKRQQAEARSDFGGVSITLIDTAGLRATDDLVEARGVGKSIRRIEAAGTVILVLDGSEPNHPDDGKLFDLASNGPPMVIVSKSDLPLRLDLEVFRSRMAGLSMFSLSVVTGEGFSDFIAALTTRCRAVSQTSGPLVTSPNIRHRKALERAAGHLDTAAELARCGEGFLDRMALELQSALAALGEITIKALARRGVSICVSVTTRKGAVPICD